MANSVTLTIDAKAVIAKFKAMGKDGPAAAYKAEGAVGDETLRLSNEQVPLDEGTLQNSGAVDEYEGHHAVGYHTPYAARLHEHPEYRFRRGRKGKYLSDPVINNKARLLEVFGESMKGKLL